MKTIVRAPKSGIRPCRRGNSTAEQFAPAYSSPPNLAIPSSPSERLSSESSELARSSSRAIPFLTVSATRSSRLAPRHGVPAIYHIREFPSAGGLVSYGPSLLRLRAARRHRRPCAQGRAPLGPSGHAQSNVLAFAFHKLDLTLIARAALQPNLAGAPNQRRIITSISSDEMKFTNPRAAPN